MTLKKVLNNNYQSLKETILQVLMCLAIATLIFVVSKQKTKKIRKHVHVNSQRQLSRDRVWPNEGLSYRNEK